MELKFSILSYHPSFITTESINVGILFYCKEKDFKVFKKTKKWKRLESFDDELNIEFTKIFLSGIEEGIAPNLFQKEEFNLENFIRFYVNEFKFSKIHCVDVDAKDIEGFIEDTHKIYLKFDHSKKDRLDKKAELKYLNMLLKSKNIEYNKDGTRGVHNEAINYDYVVDEYGIKLFEFTEKSLPNLVNHIKTWAYNADELEGKYKTIITYTNKEDLDLKENKQFKIIESIVKASKIHEFLEFEDCLELLNVK